MDKEDRKQAARDNEETVEDIEFNYDVTVYPTDNLDDINSGIFNSEVSANEDPLKDNNNNNDGGSTHFVTSVTTAISS
jgi:hypothetical protein